MANAYDPVNHVNVGDPTLKAHYDQLLQNAVVVALTTGRVVAKGGLNIAWNDALAFTMMPESFEFKLPATSDCVGLTIRLVGYMSVEVAAQVGTIRLEYFDGASWTPVANSNVSFTTITPTYTESVNLQANLFTAETRYRFTSSVASAGQRFRGMAFLTMVG